MVPDSPHVRYGKGVGVLSIECSNPCLGPLGRLVVTQTNSVRYISSRTKSFGETRTAPLLCEGFFPLRHDIAHRDITATTLDDCLWAQNNGR
jgi:hypothetical protein